MDIKVIFDSKIKEYTSTIQKAIDTCFENGGGVVSIEKGEYVVGTLQIRDNVHLNIKKDAVILGSKEMDSYPKLPYLFTDGCNERLVPEYKGFSLVYGFRANNIKIYGEGTIQGAGDNFTADIVRPFVLRLMECTNVEVRDITLKDSSAWCFHMQRSENIVIDSIKILNHGVRNADGVDIDSCKNVFINNCVIDSHDDSVCLKATSLMPCENITVTNCDLRSGCAGFKIGTESIGDFRDITVKNNKIWDCGVGAIKVTAVDGAIINNISFADNIIEDCTGPIFIAVGNRMLKFLEDKPRENMSSISNISFKNMNITTKRFERIREGVSLSDFGQGIVISGREKSKINNVSFENIHVNFYGGVTEYENGEVVSLENQYPDFMKLGILPSYGFYLSNANDVLIKNVSHKLINKDARKFICNSNASYEIVED